jgi:isopentenyl-diphosphate delta-isomerase
MAKIVTVNKKDQVLGEKSWQECHLNDGLLHRGFMILIENNQGEILLTKRSAWKPLWPLYWDNSCSSHPYPSETYIQAGKRRLREELGFTCPLKLLFKFSYAVPYKNIGWEREVCAVLWGKANGQVKPNPKEIADYRWISLKELRKDIKKRPEIFTPWLKKALSLRQEK